MGTPISNHPPFQRPIRMPFRVLAGIICIAGAIAVVGTPIMVWRGDRPLTIGNVVVLPIMAAGIRLMFRAAQNGSLPSGDDPWPFASKGIYTCYVLLLIAYFVFKM